MFYCYMDESGAPGIAQNDADYLLVAIVIFNNLEDKDAAEALIIKLRQQLLLPSDYEFHCSKDSDKTRRKFAKLLGRMRFSFAISHIRKDQQRTTASYENIAKRLVEKLEKLKVLNLRLIMDDNPLLFRELKSASKNRLNLKARQVRSSSCNLIQAADYIANIYARYLKNNKSPFLNFFINKELRS